MLTLAGIVANLLTTPLILLDITDFRQHKKAVFRVSIIETGITISTLVVETVDIKNIKSTSVPAHPQKCCLVSQL